MKKSELRKMIKEIIMESTSRYCSIWKASNNKWYLDLASKEYGGYNDATTYGPFPTENHVLKYLDRFSNPGSFNMDDSGKQAPPKKSPNGKLVIQPRF